MNYLRVPTDVSLGQLEANGVSWSPGTYRRVIIPTSQVKAVRDLLDPRRLFDRGSEPGSMWYMRTSSHHLIRTKALQHYTFLLSHKGDSITPVNPRVFKAPHLRHGDILMSKDSNVGECAMVHGDMWSQFMFSGGVLRLHPQIDRFYFFAFLKHPLFRTQLLAKVPRGATIAHAKSLWLDCVIPFPNQRDSAKVVRYVAALTEAIFDKEAALRARHSSILASIDAELRKESPGAQFGYEYPTSEKVAAAGRMDTSLYCRGFSQFKHRVESYRRGATCLSRMGLVSRRGPNLAVSVIGKSIYSDTAHTGWYELIRPVNIGEYGTLIKREWLGNRKSLPVVKRGDLILGCEGFEKGRTIVVLSDRDRCTTNFHGTVLSWPGGEVWQTVFVRCFLAYLREHGVVDWVGVGGSGGHMSPEYFDYLPFPRFPDDKQAEIARFYHSPGVAGPTIGDLGGFVAAHRRHNASLGIVELDLEAQELKRVLLEVQEQIIEGKTVSVPLPDAGECERISGN